MKVVIVDDELYICKLVKHLINWEELGLSLLGMYQSYEDTLAQFEQEVADILICDIEMPGKNGIELIKALKERYPKCQVIVISGFRNFDYVHSAMQQGVANYLLKPIDGKELNKVLEDVIFQTKEQSGLESIIAERNTRMAIFDAIRLGALDNNLILANRKYHYRFREGEFNTMILSFSNIDPKSEQIHQISRQFEDTLRQGLSNICYEVEVRRDNIARQTVLINYDAANKKRMVLMLDIILNDALARIGSISRTRIVIGVGCSVSNLADLNKSRQSAKEAWSSGYLLEGKEIFYANEESPKPNKRILLTYGQKTELKTFIEAVRPDELKAGVKEIIHSQYMQFRQNPVLIYSFFRQILDLFLNTLDELSASVEDRDGFEDQFEVLFYNAGSLVVLTERFSELLYDGLMEQLAEKQKNTVVYAQQAKNYINTHYAEPITLEKIAQKLHINSVYLSVVFKTEVGMNYSKYLTNVRMAKAKELLQTPELSIAEISNAVGYDSAYYFSTLFKKETGIKPNEYRRLHQQNIMQGGKK